MDPIEYKCWSTCSLLSLAAALVTFSISQFVELQFGNSKLTFSIIIVIMAVGFSSFVHKTKCIQTKMDLISKHRFHWIVKAIVEFSILVFVTMLIVLMKYPRYRVSDKDGSISAIRAYCQNPKFPDPQIKAICSNLPEEQKSEQGDQMGFFSAAAFSLHIFSTSMLLRLREEYGLFYMCLELTMNSAVEIPGIGGSILNWYYVGPTAFYCFVLIIVRCYYHSYDKVRRRGGNGDDHHDNNDAVDPTTVGVELQPTTGVGVELHDEENQQGGGHDAAEGGGGGRETGDQGHRTGLGSSGSGWEIVSAEEGDEHEAEMDEGKSSGEIERISSTSNVHGGRKIRRRKWAVVMQEFLWYGRKLPILIRNTIDNFFLRYGRDFILNVSLRVAHAMNMASIILSVEGTSNDVIIITYVMVTSSYLWKKFRIIPELWITCKGISNLCFGWCLIVFEFSFRFVTRILRQLGLEQNGDTNDGSEGGIGGRKTCDQGDSTGSGREIASVEEGDEHKAERDEGKSLGEILPYSSITFLYYFDLTMFVFNILVFIDRFGDATFWDSVNKAVLMIIGSLLVYVVTEFGLGFVTRMILRQLGWVLNQEGDSHDGAKGEGGRKTGDQGHSAGSGREIVSAEEGDEHKGEMAEDTSSDYENERIPSTSNVLRDRVITRRKQAMPSDQEKFPAIKADFISDRKSAATGSNFFGKSLKPLSPEKED